MPVTRPGERIPYAVSRAGHCLALPTAALWWLLSNSSDDKQLLSYRCFSGHAAWWGATVSYYTVVPQATQALLDGNHFLSLLAHLFVLRWFRFQLSMESSLSGPEPLPRAWHSVSAGQPVHGSHHRSMHHRAFGTWAILFPSEASMSYHINVPSVYLQSAYW